MASLMVIKIILCLLIVSVSVAEFDLKCYVQDRVWLRNACRGEFLVVDGASVALKANLTQFDELVAFDRSACFDSVSASVLFRLSRNDNFVCFEPCGECAKLRIVGGREKVEKLGRYCAFREVLRRRRRKSVFTALESAQNAAWRISSNGAKDVYCRQKFQIGFFNAETSGIHRLLNQHLGN